MSPRPNLIKGQAPPSKATYVPNLPPVAQALMVAFENVAAAKDDEETKNTKA
ncbi:hypothetical protein J1N35_006493 [Gossypium stocksii]|uniref:Uncharacterized protein n=1 Tax=Gossypium stocksii TaxID=47602 RepID=A0A9D4AJZ4_9ROSI|nr:hypothetical protein J1N35_006493 [Gossypium stocksii]